ncbi:MAG: hypothetical protein A2X36_05370 [Elusimicrobia bacterium GWA2_69_24]|nr:MAG: hypothetical protein A2X36_05370 [Elusimicrobia bacterium GWA2_69_24]HBL18741.1 hypothetical protein [Elusimicrobiota bacterium]
MEDELKKTVLDVCAAAEKLEIRVVLVGALVAQFSPEIGADYPKFHGTNDADFGVPVRDWDAYKKLYDVKYRSDAKDIEYWLQNFASGTQDERRYSLVGQVGMEHQDYATAGAVLMGIEVGNLASLEAAVYVDRCL